MYNVAQIKAGLIGLVGWRQNQDSTGTQLDELTTSSSGLYYNDLHPLLTFDNIFSVFPRFDLTTANQTALNAAFTAAVKQKTEASILGALSDWANLKMKNRTAKNLLSSRNLFETRPGMEIFDTDNGKFVGIELIPFRSKSLVVSVTQIGLQLSQNQSLPIYLFKAGRVAEVDSDELVYIGSGGLQWFDAAWSLLSGDAYYIGYKQDDLTGQSINGAISYGYDSQGLTEFPTEMYFKASAFSSNGNGAAMWDIKTNQYTVATNYGINLSLDVKCDYTALILDQKDLFKEAIQYRVAIDFMKELMFNSNARINRNEENIDYSKVLYEIEGDTRGSNKHTLTSRYKSALMSIQLDDTGMDPVCLPCRRRSISYRAIGVKA